ncbi:MAG TPA: sigma-54 dependent transcriptional regulator [Burkholderiaceae bacterium]|nr:sigma-54 dependent transcriptional regulator [Burkholderiaceae bacterium]
MARLLIIDDDAAFRDTLAETLTSLDHEVEAVASGALGLRAMAKSRFAAIFLDYRMSGMDGLQVLAAMREHLPDAKPVPPVIVLTAMASGGNTIEAMRLGAFDHLTKPIGRAAVIEVLGRALRAELPGPAPGAPASGADELVGASAAMRDVHKRIGMAAASDLPVLILGETGTGKEMVARALHRHSTRANLPFIALNCAAIPKELLESELFGHVRGAFTGAATERPGCFRAADGGLLLLDEIGDMAPAVQAKILRVLQEKEVTPLGSHRAIKVDVRVVAATHRDLPAAVGDGSFREDLMYRLNVLSIRVPPLRDRLADIITLAEHFLLAAATRANAAPKALSNAAAQRLLQHSWPGNVRELRNLMDRCQALVRHAVIGAGDLDLADSVVTLGLSALPSSWLEADLPAATERLERALITHALGTCGGNRAEAARRLGIHRQLLYRKIAQYGLDEPE